MFISFFLFFRYVWSFLTLPFCGNFIGLLGDANRMPQRVNQLNCIWIHVLCERWNKSNFLKCKHLLFSTSFSRFEESFSFYFVVVGIFFYFGCPRERALLIPFNACTKWYREQKRQRKDMKQDEMEKNQQH